MSRLLMVAVAAVVVAAQAKDADELFRGSRWIEQPKELNAAAPRFTTTFKVVLSLPCAHNVIATYPRSGRTHL